MKTANCHPERKHQARGYCKPCYDKWLKLTNPVYKSAQISNTTIWARNNPDKMRIIQERRKEKDRKDPNTKTKQRKQLLKKYNLTLEQYSDMLKKQDGKCALCYRASKPGKHLHVDHDHDTLRVRGLLCHQCNWYMGTVDADPSILDRIKDYKKE